MIVVGVDGSRAAERALQWAAAEARLRGSDITVAYAYQHPVTASWSDGGSVVHPWMREAEDHARAAAEELVGRLAATVPDVEVQPVIAEGERPADLLVRLSGDAELVVVGTRGHGAVAGMFLGSVSHQCVIRARCPVVVIPPEDHTTDG
jgi:nucleotide-binding universal stress UspA family protein